VAARKDEFTEDRFGRRTLIAGQTVALGLSFYLSYRLLPAYRPLLRSGPWTLAPFREYAWLLLAIFPLWYLLMERYGLLSIRRVSAGELVSATLRVSALGLASLTLIIFAAKSTTMSRLLIFGFGLLAVPATLIARQGLAAWLAARRTHTHNIVRAVVVGTRCRAQEFVRAARATPDSGYELVGCFDPEPQTASAEVEGIPLLGSTDAIDAYLFAHPVDLVVVAMPPHRVPGFRERMDAALTLGLRVAVLPDFYLRHLGTPLDETCIRLEPMAGFPAIAFSSVDHSFSYLVAKRAIDVAVSAALLVLLSPVFLLLALAVKLTSPDGPVFYRWRVVGVNRKPFTGYKFRTMVANAEQLKPALLEQNEMQGPVFKLRGDPRITPLGRILRRYSLDELPQLWSVLRGDMSLVGPRPPFAEEASRFEFWQRRKLSVKPGITCLWQVNGRNEIQSFDQWARLDLEYIESASLWLDCKILLKTIPVVLRGRGAY
jgi:exopolysaccharide biosynthesis polyprenyl glycosylphosphotransferase